MKFGSLFWPCGNYRSSKFGCYVLLLCPCVVAGEGQKGNPQKKLLQLYISWCVFLPSSFFVCKFMKAVTKLELGERRRFHRVGRCKLHALRCTKGSIVPITVHLCSCTTGHLWMWQAWLFWLSPCLDLNSLMLQFGLWRGLIMWPKSQIAVGFTCHSSNKEKQIISLSAAFIAQSGKSENISGWIKTRQWRGMSIILKEIRIMRCCTL